MTTSHAATVFVPVQAGTVADANEVEELVLGAADVLALARFPSVSGHRTTILDRVPALVERDDVWGLAFDVEITPTGGAT